MQIYEHLDDVYIQLCRGEVEKLFLIHLLMLLPSKPRVIVIVNDSHKPTLKLLRAMGVLFIFSLSDSLSDFEKILQCSTNENYISPDLFATIHPVQSSTARAMNRDFFNGIKYLTLSETNIILYLLNGIPPWLVARKLCISVKTVSSHKINALRKMNLSGINEFFIP